MRNKFDQFFDDFNYALTEGAGLYVPFERGQPKENNEVHFSSSPAPKTPEESPISPAQTDKPPVEGDPEIVARRNRRLRSHTRNWQLWNNKEKKWINPNARYTRRRDVEEEIKKMNPSD